MPTNNSTLATFYLTKFLIESLPNFNMPSYCDIPDIINQCLVDLSVIAYQQSLEKKPMSDYIKSDVNTLDNYDFDMIRMRYQRTIGYIDNKKAKFNSINKSITNSKDEQTKITNVKDRYIGYGFTPLEWWELENIHSMKLVKNIVEKRIGNKNFTKEKIREMIEDYNARKKDLLNSYDKCFAFSALYILETRYSFEFIKKIISESINNPPNDMNTFSVPISHFCADSFTMPEFLLPGHFDSDEDLNIANRSIMLKQKSVSSIINTQSDKYYDLCNQYHQVQLIIYFLENDCCIENTPIKVWFMNETKEEDWLSVFNDYGLLKLNSNYAS